MPETLVLLHGFGGTRQMWDGVVAQLDRQRYRPLALDLPGHGDAAPDPGSITFETCGEAVLAAAPERFTLCGYSMGGRIALQIALAAPERVTRLVLVASSPGIEDPDERAQRRAADGQLADALEQGPFEAFIDRWNGQPLFAADRPGVARLAREDQRRNDPRSLAAVLRALGTGEMPPLWSRLGTLAMPVRLLVGERDAKFVSLGRQMLDLLGPSSDLMLLPGGHRLPLESPAAVAAAIAERLASERLP